MIGEERSRSRMTKRGGSTKHQLPIHGEVLVVVVGQQQ
jgi:hypothetical protein